MDYQYVFIIIPNLVMFAISSWVAFKIYTGKSTEFRLAMTICFSFIAINALIPLGEKLIPYIDIVLILVALEYLTYTIILSTLLIFVMQYVGMGKLVTLRNILIIGTPGLLCVVLYATNPLHNLFYVSVELMESRGFYLLVVEYGAFFFVWMAYFFMIIIITTALVARTVMETPSHENKALRALLMAMVIIMVTGIVIIIDPNIDPLIDVLSIGLTLTILTIFIGERRVEFIDLEIIRFRETIDGMEDAVLIMDSSLHIIFVNQQGQRILDENLEFIKERVVARGLRIPVGSHKWETALNLNGSPRYFSVTTSDIFRGDKSIGAVLVFHDITNRRMMEEEIRKANHELSILNQIVRHDTRNDLTALWGYLESLKATELNARQMELIDKMADRARSADKHLTFVNNQQSPGSSGAVWQDVQALIEGASSQVEMGEMIVESRVQGIKVMADPMLPNVFHCLVDNTVRHGLKATKITVHAEQTETGLSILWEDDGIGVPIEHKERIFERGFGQNTGEGLFLAYDILSLTGASISEEGVPGKGARFIIRVPSGWYTWVSTTGP